MIQKILLLVLFLYIFNNKNKTTEGVRNSLHPETYCGSNALKSFLFSERCGSGHVYSVIKNCIGDDDNFSKGGDCKLCNSGNYGKCHPTFKGGYCNLTHNKKTDASGSELDNPGRDLNGLTEEEIRDYDEDKYQEIKNECNPFFSGADSDYEDERNEDGGGDGDGDGEGEEDRIERRYRRSRRSRRGSGSRRGSRRGSRPGSRRESRVRNIEKQNSLRDELKVERQNSHYYQSLDDKIKYGFLAVFILLIGAGIYNREKLKIYLEPYIPTILKNMFKTKAVDGENIKPNIPDIKPNIEKKI